MNDLYGLFRILFIHQYGYLNLAGGYHVDINVGVVESLKQGGSHARMINHTRSHHGNLGNMAVGLQMAKANGLLMLLQEHGSRLQVGLGNGKAYVLALLMADSL